MKYYSMEILSLWRVPITVTNQDAMECNKFFCWRLFKWRRNFQCEGVHFSRTKVDIVIQWSHICGLYDYISLMIWGALFAIQSTSLWYWLHTSPVKPYVFAPFFRRSVPSTYFLRCLTGGLRICHWSVYTKASVKSWWKNQSLGKL